MSEKTATAVSNHEAHKNNEQLLEIGNERAEILKNKLEQAEKAHKEKLSEAEVLKQAHELANEQDEKQKRAETKSPAERRRGPISKKQLNNSFASQMNHARDHMSPTSRVFSRFIHAKPVELVSDFVGSTIARPNALLSGSIVAFIAITILYFTAKHFGFRLSGFETIGAFIVGWIIGALYDYVSVAFRGRHR